MEFSIHSSHIDTGIISSERQTMSGKCDLDIWWSVIDPHLEKLRGDNSCLSVEELSRFKKFKIENDAFEYRYAHRFLKEVLSKYLSIKASDIIWETGIHGKPKLNVRHDIQFNMSHTTSLVMMAVSHRCEVGVDVEFIKTDFKFENLIKQFYNPLEIRYIQDSSKKKMTGRFFEIWTRKEAFLKMQGIGLSKMMPEIIVLDGKNCFKYPVITKMNDQLDHDHAEIISFSPLSGYIASCAISDIIQEIRFHSKQLY